MLCCLSSNRYLNELIIKKIQKNNNDIKFLNTIENENGRIFETIMAMSNEDIKRLLSIRESKDNIDFNDNVLISLDDKIKVLLFSKLTKENIDAKKDECCKEKELKMKYIFK